ncbi:MULTISPECIES: hypothetical protein [Bacillus cereus group]|nr:MULTISPECIES: hypothetical protein [Bacillus cereus group]MDA2611361.1 hypothetical protein [Bacillus cereus]MEB8554782.1 hypothetical protein [Bacillus cereus]MEB8725290.1 hypothetical protein [Bacillus cereus]MEB8820199.1 hypothetical protein [Bacillus cereus]MEB8972312.1 hypothetical protein [Bacillus cereus]
MKSDKMIIDFAALRIQNGVYIAGAAIEFLNFDDEAKRIYIPYKVASLYINDTEVNSMRKCIKWLLKRLSKEVPEGVTQIIFRSDLPHLIRNRYYRKEIESLTGAEVFIKHVPMLGNKRNEIRLLANDALIRKNSVMGEIK